MKPSSKATVFHFLFSIFVMLIVNDVAVASGSGSHGGDNRHLSDVAAWFPRYYETRNRTITYCYILDPKFSVQDSSRIESAIETAYNEWYTYVSSAKEAKEIHWVSKDRDDVKLIAPATTCDDNVDLKFYLGHTDDSIKKEADGFRNPALFSHIEQRDPQTGWGKGYTWLHNANDDSPDTKFVYNDILDGPNSPMNFLRLSVTWRSTLAFELAIKHEMGHIFGVPHLEGTIMDIDFLRWMPAGGLGGPRSIPILSIDRAKAILERKIEESTIVVNLKTLSKYADITILPENRARLSVTLRKNGESIKLEGIINKADFKIQFEEANDTLLSKSPLNGSVQTGVVSCSPQEYYPPNEGRKIMIRCLEIKQKSLVKEFKVAVVNPQKEKPEYHHFLITRNMGECDKTPFGIRISEPSEDQFFQECPIW